MLGVAPPGKEGTSGNSFEDAERHLLVGSGGKGVWLGVAGGDAIDIGFGDGGTDEVLGRHHRVGA